MQKTGSPGQDEHSSEEQQKSLKTVANRLQTRRIRTFVAYDTLDAGDAADLVFQFTAQPQAPAKTTAGACGWAVNNEGKHEPLVDGFRQII